MCLGQIRVCVCGGGCPVITSEAAECNEQGIEREILCPSKNPRYGESIQKEPPIRSLGSSCSEFKLSCLGF